MLCLYKLFPSASLTFSDLPNEAKRENILWLPKEDKKIVIFDYTSGPNYSVISDLLIFIASLFFTFHTLMKGKREKDVRKKPLNRAFYA